MTNPQRIRQYREMSRTPIRLDSPIGGDDPTSIAETVADENAAAPFDGLVKDNDLNMLHEAREALDARERKVVSMRFGFDDGRPETLDQVGKSIGLTRELIRQNQQQALEKLRQRIEKLDPLSSRRLADRGSGNI